MWIFGGRVSLTAPSLRRDMWRTLSVLVVLVLSTEVSQSQDVGSVTAFTTEVPTPQENYSSFSAVLGKSKHQILAAQFECYLKILYEPPRAKEGTYCNRTWDGWLCWGDSAPGTTMQMCPAYFIDFDPDEKVTKVCNHDGQWFHHPESNRVWSNYTQCEAYTKDKFKFAIGLYYMSMVGHGLSIVSLIIGLIIFSYFKSLSCQRISLHKNMFLSFILNSIVTMLWLSLSHHNTSYPVSCKILAVLTQYSTASSYFWMLCQGIYLHTLIIVAVFVGEQQLFWYYVLGWGFPMVPVATYAVARGLYYNDNCWMSSHTQLVYIIHGPIQVALSVNFLFLLNIVRVLITKLRVTHRAQSNSYMKAVRATLILIPLLGVQFFFIPMRPEGHISRTVHDLFIIILSNFQGLLVAIIFCFCNNEAQATLKRKWAQRKFARGKTGWGEIPVTNNHFNSHTNSSIVEMSRTPTNLEHPAAVTFGANKSSVSVSNGQKKNDMCSNGEADVLRSLETTDI